MLFMEQARYYFCRFRDLFININWKGSRVKDYIQLFQSKIFIPSFAKKIFSYTWINKNKNNLKQTPQLPTELWLHIFSFCSDRELGNLLRISKEFHSLATDILQKRVDLKRVDLLILSYYRDYLNALENCPASSAGRSVSVMIDGKRMIFAAGTKSPWRSRGEQLLNKHLTTQKEILNDYKFNLIVLIPDDKDKQNIDKAILARTAYSIKASTRYALKVIEDNINTKLPDTQLYAGEIQKMIPHLEQAKGIRPFPQQMETEICVISFLSKK